MRISDCIDDGRFAAVIPADKRGHATVECNVERCVTIPKLAEILGSKFRRNA